MSEVEVAIVDVETTGFFPQRHDRVVEIAAVVVNSRGDVVRQFATLVNPQRDMGPTSLHGISAADAAQAPTFSELAGDLIETMSGCVAIAGHNVSFDSRFLEAEFARAGVALPDVPTVCTMLLAG